MRQVASTALTNYLRSLLPCVQQISALLLIAAGAYMLSTELPVLVHQSAWTPSVPAE
jgi:hypothetical protein